MYSRRQPSYDVFKTLWNSLNRDFDVTLPQVDVQAVVFYVQLFGIVWAFVWVILKCVQWTEQRREAKGREQRAVELKEEEKRRTKEELQLQIAREAEQLHETLRQSELESHQKFLRQYELEDEDDSRVLMPSTMSLLYSRGVQYQEDNEKEKALESFLCILYGIGRGSDSSGFLHIVECIHRVATLYRELGVVPMAIRFLQAEKFIYENALLHFATGDQILQNSTLRSFLKDDVPKALHEHTMKMAGQLTESSGQHQLSKRKALYAVRMKSFTELAKLYHKEKNRVMAMNYAIKAIRLRKDLSKNQNIENTEQYEVLMMCYVALSEWQMNQRMEEDTRNKLETSQLRSLLSKNMQLTNRLQQNDPPSALPTPSPQALQPIEQNKQSLTTRRPSEVSAKEKRARTRSGSAGARDKRAERSRRVRRVRFAEDGGEREDIGTSTN